MNKNMTLPENVSVFLDFLRAFSAQAVVFGHGISFLGIWTFLSPPSAGFYIQNISVVVFFYISGVVITFSILYKNKERKYSIGEYLFDRLTRLYITLIPCLLVIFILDYMRYYITGDIQYFSSSDIKHFFGNILFLQDFKVSLGPLGEINSHITSFGSGRPLWTLANEWWLYIFYGFVYLGNFNGVISRFLGIIIFTISFFYVYLITVSGRGDGLGLVWLFGSFSVHYVIFSRDYLSTRKEIPLLFFILAFLSAINFLKLSGETFHILTNIAIAIALLSFLSILIRIKVCFFSEKIKNYIKYFANYSFTLYIIHYSVFMSLISFAKGIISDFYLFLIGMLLSNILAIVVATHTEFKYKKYRENLRKLIKL